MSASIRIFPAYPINSIKQEFSHLLAEEESQHLDNESSPLMRSKKKRHIFAKRIMCRDSLKPVSVFPTFLHEHFYFLWVITRRIKGEDIYIQSNNAWSVPSLHQSGILVAELYERQIISFMCFSRNKFIAPKILSPADFNKPVIIRPWHCHVNVIIPRNNTFMTHSTDSSTTNCIIGKSMPMA